MIIDVDSTIIRTKADKQDAAPTYKRTYGHYPVAGGCVCGGPTRSSPASDPNWSPSGGQPWLTVAWSVN